MRVVLFIFIMSLSCLICDGQTKRASAKSKLIERYSFYNKKNNALIANLNSIKYDSVKVFYLNERKDDTENFSLVVDTPNIYNVVRFRAEHHPNDSTLQYTALPGSNTSDKGKVMLRKDGDRLLQLLKDSYKDSYLDDPVGPYTPTLGFAYFKNAIVYAHLDCAIAEGKTELEIFRNGQKAYRYNWSVAGLKTNEFLKALVKKYNLPSWVLSGN